MGVSPGNFPRLPLYPRSHRRRYFFTPWTSHTEAEFLAPAPCHAHTLTKTVHFVPFGGFLSLLCVRSICFDPIVQHRSFLSLANAKLVFWRRISQPPSSVTFLLKIPAGKDTTANHDLIHQLATRTDGPKYPRTLQFPPSPRTPNIDWSTSVIDTLPSSRPHRLDFHLASITIHQKPIRPNPHAPRTHSPIRTLRYLQSTNPSTSHHPYPSPTPGQRTYSSHVIAK